MNAGEAKKILSLYKDLSAVDRLHIYVRLRRLPFEVVEKYIPKKGKILDFGCGHGFFSLYISSKSKQREIIGVDISAKKVSTANSSVHDKTVSFKYSQKTATFLEKKSYYSAIAILNVLYLMKREDQEKILEAASTALVKGGKLLIIEPDANLKIRTFYEIMRESIMIKLLGLTSGATLTYNKKQWWIKTLKKNFKRVEYKELEGRKHHLLYICSK